MPEPRAVARSVVRVEANDTVFQTLCLEREQVRGQGYDGVGGHGLCLEVPGNTMFAVDRLAFWRSDIATHGPVREGTRVDRSVSQDGKAVMAPVVLDAVESVPEVSGFAFQDLHEVRFVENQEPGNAVAGVIDFRDLDNVAYRIERAGLSGAAKAMIDQLRQQSTPLGFSHRQNRGDRLLNRIVLDG